MTYDPIDTDETDDTADGKVSIDSINITGKINEADISSSSSGDALLSDGTGGLQFSKVEGIPAGGIIMFSGSTTNIPSGFTLCDGSGGAPDLRDRFVMGAGGSRDSQQTGGENSVSLSVNEIPSHSHGVNDPGHDHRNTEPGGKNGGIDHNRDGNCHRNRRNRDTDNATTGISIRSTGGGQSHENKPRFMALAYIQKL